MKVTRRKNSLKIEIPLKDHGSSKSGKTTLVATSHGLVTTEITFKGRPVVVVFNAFVYPKKREAE